MVSLGAVCRTYSARKVLPWCLLELFAGLTLHKRCYHGVSWSCLQDLLCTKGVTMVSLGAVCRTYSAQKVLPWCLLELFAGLTLHKSDVMKIIIVLQRFT